MLRITDLVRIRVRVTLSLGGWAGRVAYQRLGQGELGRKGWIRISGSGCSGMVRVKVCR